VNWISHKPAKHNTVHFILIILLSAIIINFESQVLVCNGEGNFKYIYRGDNKVAPMPNHHLMKGYRPSRHKALPILDPGIK